jgi:hypothetical protein
MRSNSAWLVALGATTSSSRPAPSWVARNTAWWIDQLAGTWLLAAHPGGPVFTSTFIPVDDALRAAWEFRVGHAAEDRERVAGGAGDRHGTPGSLTREWSWGFAEWALVWW